MLLKETKNITSINSAVQKKRIIDLLINKEIGENTISESLNISMREAMDFLEKCYIDADFQYQSNEILIDFVNKHLNIDEKTLNDEVVKGSFKKIMNIDTYED